MNKYVCVGGKVISKNDGNEHYITSRQLMKLYGLNECICDLVEENEYPSYCRQLGGDCAYRPIVLKPRYDGNYNLFRELK